MTCLECLNVTSVVDDRCDELANSYPYLSDTALLEIYSTFLT